MKPADPDRDQRLEAVWRFVAAALNGNVPAFLASLPTLNWSGAFREAFVEIAHIGYVHPDIQHVFAQVWKHGRLSEPHGINLNQHLWETKRTDPELFSKAIRLLVPHNVIDIPYLLYRGQSLSEYKCGRLGSWWTPCPLVAEWFARSDTRQHVGERCIIVAFKPKEAILAQLCEFEFLVDTAKLNEHQLVVVPPPYTPDEELSERMSDVTILDRVPNGYAAEAAQEFRERLMRRRDTGSKMCTGNKRASVIEQERTRHRNPHRSHPENPLIASLLQLQQKLIESSV